jgi:hypothetical protein
MDLVSELKNFVVNTGAALLIYPKVVRKMCERDFFLKHLLPKQEFEEAWEGLGLGAQVQYVSNNIC